MRSSCGPLNRVAVGLVTEVSSASVAVLLPNPFTLVLGWAGPRYKTVISGPVETTCVCLASAFIVVEPRSLARPSASMGKRASNQTAAGKAKAAKTASPGKVAKASPFQPELELLQVAELPAACRQMLVAMLPQCLGTPEAERHEAQKAVADTFDKIFAGLESDRESAVAAAQSALRSSEAELAPRWDLCRAKARG